MKRPYLIPAIEGYIYDGVSSLQNIALTQAAIMNTYTRTMKNPKEVWDTFKQQLLPKISDFAITGETVKWHDQELGVTITNRKTILTITLP